jgi:hypothetical protein
LPAGTCLPYAGCSGLFYSILQTHSSYISRVCMTEGAGLMWRNGSGNQKLRDYTTSSVARGLYCCEIVMKDSLLTSDPSLLSDTGAAAGCRGKTIAGHSARITIVCEPARKKDRDLSSAFCCCVDITSSRSF